MCCLKNLCLIFFLLFAGCVYAQVPVINSFSPLGGPVGTVVSIAGANFDSNPANNIVFFGAAQANVIASNQSSITVSVPAGSTYKPITVNVNGLMVYTNSPFTVTFNGPAFGANSLKSKVDVFINNHSIAIKDIDNDGKADIITANNSLSILKNDSQIGAPVFFSVGSYYNSYLPGLAVDDLTGDGKPDIVVADYSNNKIAVFVNSTVNNQISFIPAGVYDTGVNPYKVAIADFNGDGRPDIVVSNTSFQANSVSVFYNTTPTGGFFSVLPGKQFPTQAAPRGVTSADINMDGKVDIVVTCQSGFLTILKNISTINNLDFVSSYFNLPSGSAPEAAVIADFDGDQKPDIATSNNSSNNISILKNNSTGGNFSFLPRQDLAAGQINFGISAGDINGDGKPDIVVSNQTGSSASVFINTTTGNNITFNNRLDFTAGDQSRDIAIADVDGDNIPDLIVANNNGGSISILLANTQKTQAVINFPVPVQPNIGADNVLITGATSNNNETPIVYTSSNPSVAYIRADGKIVIIAPGTTTITANQPETESFLAASPITRTYIIKQNQSILFPAINPKSLCDADFNINASSATPQPLVYGVSNNTVATISSTGVVHIIGAGVTTITVSQPGNNLYEDALPQSRVLTVTAPLPPLVSIAANNNSVCAGSTVIFTATVTNTSSNTYEWFVNNLPQGGNSFQLTVNNIKSTDVIQCRVTAGGICPASGTSNTLSVAVQNFATPIIKLQVNGGAFCAGTPVVATATPINQGSNPKYEWRVNNVLVGTTTLPSFTYSNFANGDKLTCMLSNNGGQCLTATTAISNEVTISITAPTDLLVSITASATSVYGGVPVTFTATAQIPIATYQWRLNNAAIGSNSSIFTTASLKNGDRVSCTVTSAQACAVPFTSPEIVMQILQPTDIKIPNAFTPNADGINDVWVIADLAFYPDCIVKIFNRNGALLYTSKGYATAWDGTVNGKKLPSGTYYYIIDSQALVNNRLSGYVSILQ